MRTFPVTVAFCGILISCGGGGSGGVTGTGGQSGAGGAEANTGPASPISVRVVNTFLPSATATTGPSLDIYDSISLTQSASAKPIIAGLAFGAVSSYVTPHFSANNGSMRVTLTALPAGSLPTDTADAQYIWGDDSDGRALQVTVLLSTQRNDELPSRPLSGLSFSTFVEKGDDANDGMGPLAPVPPSGQGEFLVITAPLDDVTTGGIPGYYFFVDASCTPPLNGDPNVPGVPYAFATSSATYDTPFALFPAAPGAHSVSVASWTSSTSPTCPELTLLQGTTPQSLTAGQQILAFIYGSSPTDAHIALGPIAP